MSKYYLENSYELMIYLKEFGLVARGKVPIIDMMYMTINLEDGTYYPYSSVVICQISHEEISREDLDNILKGYKRNDTIDSILDE